MYTYDPREVTLTVDGGAIVGFAEGTYITAEKDEDLYTEHVGSQGEVTRSRNPHPMGEITVTLKSSSPSNKKLFDLSQSQELFGVFVVDDNTGAFSAGGNKCWVQKPAGRDLGQEEGERDWTIRIADWDQEEEYRG